jgi:hypothetical protein
MPLKCSRCRRATMLILRAVVIVLPVLVLAGCASGSVIGSLPPVPDPSQSASVVIARPYSVFGSARTPTITVDGEDVYEIGPGEHVVFAIAPGEHIIGIKLWDLVTHRRTAVILAEPGRRYYFVTSPGAPFEQISEREGRGLVAETTPIEQNAWQGRTWGDRRP